ncbi:uncharacterized protein LOC133223114 [Neopsephotus bourkii]|uniref:uncharacterized protein LOC133223114 n=1 Tax=Neopsephotus bourkii TaxID=309878 RepID=UPI002AA57F66|nr:uncharacterized protein LOC133223114 [Neopsephotus bourkii]
MTSQTSAPGRRQRAREPAVRRWGLEAEKGPVTAARTVAAGRHLRRSARCVSPRPHPLSPAPPGDFFARVTPGWDVRSSERPVPRCYIRLPFAFHPKRTPRSVAAGAGGGATPPSRGWECGAAPPAAKWRPRQLGPTVTAKTHESVNDWNSNVRHCCTMPRSLSSGELPPAGLMSRSLSVLTFGSRKCSTSGPKVQPRQTLRSRCKLP